MLVDFFFLFNFFNFIFNFVMLSYWHYPQGDLAMYDWIYRPAMKSEFGLNLFFYHGNSLDFLQFLVI